MMDDEGLRARPAQPPRLDMMSIDELAARVAALKQEIAACEALIAQKERVRAAAETVFGSAKD